MATPDSITLARCCPCHMEMLQRTVDQAGQVGDGLGWRQVQLRQLLQEDLNANAGLLVGSVNQALSHY